MNSSLTEEQRLRTEANRQRALDKKYRRHLEGERSTNETFDNSNLSPKNSSVRESFGDSSIDWNAAVQEMDRIIAANKLQSNYAASHNNMNKRKLDDAIEMNSASCERIHSDHINSTHALLGENNHNRVHSNTRSDSFDNDKHNTIIMKSQMTDEQKLRMERNRLRALEKKKLAVNSSATTLSFSLTEDKNSLVQDISKKGSEKSFGGPSHANVNNLEKKSASTSIVHKDVLAHVIKGSSLIHNDIESSRSTTPIGMYKATDYQRGPATDEYELISSETNQSSKQSDANSCSLTEKQSVLIEENKPFSLQRKQSSFRNSEHHNSDLHSMGNRQSNPACPLTTDQRTLIEDARIVAQQKKQPPYLMPHDASSLEDQFCEQHLSEQKASAKGSSICSALSNIIQTQLLPSGCTPTSSHTPSISSERDRVETSANDTSQHRYQFTSETVGHYDTSKNQLSQSYGKRESPDLPQIPPDIQYAEARCLPVDDGKINSLIVNAELDEPLLNGWSLYDHQKEGVLRALRMRRLILAFDMGLGKTIIGCVWSKAFIKTYKSLKVFIIAPVSLMEDWRRTAKEATGLTAHDGKKKPKRIAKSNVAGYKSITDEHSGDYVVICDEAHNMQSMTSRRTEDALKLTLAKRCLGVLLLSGTPMKNGRPSNLFPLLKAVKHPFGDNQRKYEFYFCNGQQRFMNGREVWDASGSSNLKELHAHTSSHIFRMTKDECMSGELCQKKREYLEVPVSARQELRYNQALKDLAQAFGAMEGTNGERRHDDNENNILQPFNHLRQASSSAKIDATVALANEILKEEGSIVIFTSFVAVAKDVHRNLEAMGWNGQLLTGETAPGRRQEMVDDFQSGVTPIFVCTYGAGGVGLTLTAACTVILIDRPWTPGDVNQAEDRVRRIGQTRPVRSIWIRAFPIDEQIDALLDHKEVNSFTAVDGKEGCGHPRKAPKISISELVKTTLSNQASP
eukprot:CCRYP_010485-RC/>CCRYP_010485-RC protein AED:0.11 eAED:0.11 QI:337/0.85/0.75/1/0.85/0.75/8/1228/966